jgi:dienelactone hydrolase
MMDVTIDFESEKLASPWFPAGDGVPAVLILPTVMGVSDLERDFAARLNALGYGAMIGDLFGLATRGLGRDDMFGHLGRLKGDRSTLLRRLHALLGSLGERDPSRIAVIGFCFGGLCALDIARSGAAVAGVASFHGLFDPPGLPPQPIKAKVLAMHGWDDPMVPPEAVVALASELTEGGADWQIHAYGHTGHGFTNPHAHQIGIEGVAFQEAAARRSWAALEDFLAELFA